MMNNSNGVFIVLEGTDGSGKSTQFKLLRERLRAVGYEVEVFHFPRYHKTSSHFVQRYLNGDYGPAKNVNPYTASLFYALDRFEAAPAIRKALAAGKIVLSDRYVGSNMAHQGGKLSDSIAQRGFFVWNDGLEYQLLGIPRPNFNFYLRVPAEVAYRLSGNEIKRQYTNAARDQHENDIDHLRRSITTYDSLCQLFPKDFQAIECTNDGKMLSVAAINDLLWEKLKPVLPQKPPHAGKNLVVRLDQNENDKGEDQPDNKPNHSKVINLNIKKVSLLAINQIQAFGDVSSAVTAVDWPANDQYNHFTPGGLTKNVAPIYKASMQKLLRLHRQMLQRAAHSPALAQALTACVPLAAQATARISGSPEQILGLTKQLQTSPLAEVRWLAGQLTAAGQKLYPRDFKVPAASRPVPESANNEPPGDVIAKLVAEHLPQTLPSQTHDVVLLEVHPRNEFDLLLDGLYSYSTASRADIAADIDQWSYQQKREALLAAAAQENTQILRQAAYLWNIICDRPTLEQLGSAIALDEPKTQPPTPRYGYNVPEIIEEAGISDDFLECFDESLKLFSSLQAAGREDLAAYATLLGHKNRWQFTTNAESIKSAKTPSNTEVQNLLGAMREKINQTHPLLGEFITAGPPPKPSAPKPKTKKHARKPKK